MQCLQPVDPDAQKQHILKKYEQNLRQAIELFTLDMQQRSIHLFKHVNTRFCFFFLAAKQI